jgi:hypothetical protein
MLKKYKNAILQIIRDENLDPLLFEVEESPTNFSEDVTDEELSSFKICYKNTPLYYLFRNAGDDFHSFDYIYVKFAPLLPEVIYEDVRHEWNGDLWISFEEIKVNFRYWLNNSIKEYINESLSVDQWKQLDLQTDMGMRLFLSNDDKLPFTEAEKIQLHLSINEFKMLIDTTFCPNVEETKTINDRLDYLAESVDRLNRIDWRSLALSTVLSISIALSLDKQNGQILIDLFKRIFINVVRLLT